MEKYKKVVVTGGAGCIGLEVCRLLKQRNVQVSILDLEEQIPRVLPEIPDEVQICGGSVLDPQAVDHCIKGSHAVIHLAAFMGVQKTEMNPENCLRVNFQGTRNVLNAAVKHRVNRFVFASSSEVYGEPLENPINEDSAINGSSIYAKSKLKGEHLCKAYHAKHPWMSYTILRYFNTYGPNQVAQFAVPRFIKAVLKGEPPQVYGEGNQKRSFCYVRDIAWATVAALASKGAEQETMNIGSDTSILTIAELAQLIIDLCKKMEKLKPDVYHTYDGSDRSAKREILERYCDLSKSKRILNFRPRTSLIDGLRKTMESGNLFYDWVY